MKFHPFAGIGLFPAFGVFDEAPLDAGLDDVFKQNARADEILAQRVKTKISLITEHQTVVWAEVGEAPVHAVDGLPEDAVGFRFRRLGFQFKDVFRCHNESLSQGRPTISLR